MRTILAFMVTGFFLVAACGKGPSQASPAPAPVPTVATAPAPVTPPPPPPPPEESPAEKMKGYSSLSSALTAIQDDMTDTVDTVSQGAVLLGIWAAKNMTWQDVGVAKDETSYSLAQKDIDEARGKRLCVTGSIIQIAVEKTPLGKFHEGLLMAWGGKLFQFMNVGTSGDLVEGRQARMCGVVTGKYDYHNSGGGMGHAIQVVGMFDLAENRKR